MIKINENYLKLQASYLFAEIKSRTAAFQAAHPEKEVISPKDFLQTAEECDLIVPIGEWMIETICKQLKAWKDAGMEDQNISVNLGPQQFKERDIVSKFSQMMAEYGIEGSEITIEVPIDINSSITHRPHINRAQPTYKKFEILSASHLKKNPLLTQPR